MKAASPLGFESKHSDLIAFRYNSGILMIYLTGYPSPGISWYVNGQLIPVITVQRGRDYIFYVYGGDEHGFYITNDSMGGYLIQTPDEREVRGGITTENQFPFQNWRTCFQTVRNPQFHVGY